MHDWVFAVLVLESEPVDRGCRHRAGRRSRPEHAANQPPAPRRMTVVFAPDNE
jgi:hypothetical protein